LYRKVDPAALLLAILTVGINPLESPGPWDNINSFVATVVGVILVAFTWPRRANLLDESGKPAKVDAWATAATALVYGLVITTGVAWPVQFYWTLPACSPSCSDADRIAGYATYWAAGIGGVCAIILFFVMRKWIKNIDRSVTATS
jgi:hypothetical protein